MRNYLRFLLTTGLIVIVLSLSLSGCSTNYKGNSQQVMEKLNIDASLSENGDMTVRETWKVDLKDRGKAYTNLYRTFPVDAEKVDGIDLISVYDEDLKVEYDFAGDVDPESASYTAMDHKSYLHQTADKTEIGWFMPPIQEGIRTFTVTYRIRNIVQVYKDTAVLYSFFQKDFKLPVTDFSVCIHFPGGGEKKDVHAWLHTTAESSLTVDSARQVSVAVSHIPAGTSVEVRLCMPPELFSASTKRISQNVLPQIQQEEQKWAADYKAELWRQYILGLVDAIGAVLVVLASIAAFIIIRKKYRRHTVEAHDYTREIPKGNSPAGIANLFYFYDGVGEKEKNRVFSATLLSLARKGYVSLQDQNGDFAVTIIGDTKQIGLTESEQAFYEMISTVAEEFDNTFTMQMFKKYAKVHYEYVEHTVDLFLRASKKEISDRSYYEVRPLYFSAVKGIGFLLIFAAFVSFIGSAMIGTLLVYLPLSFLIAGILLITAGSVKQRLSMEGERDYAVWHGLKRFMLEFSRMKEYGVPQLELWEEYLVYATMMGISSEVCKQLKLVYPQLSDETYVNTYFAGSYLYYMFAPRLYMGGFSPAGGAFNFGETLGNTLGEINAAATRLAHPPTSGGGNFGGGGFGGGGFSGGGGGFGGGGGGVR